MGANKKLHPTLGVCDSVCQVQSYNPFSVFVGLQFGYKFDHKIISI